VTEFLELIVSFPAVVFTTALLFCLAWLLVTTVLGFGGHQHGGHDGHHLGHGHGGHELHIGHGHGHGGHDVGHGHGGHGGQDGGHGHHGHGDGHGGGDKGPNPSAGISTLPPAISLSMISFAGWVVSVGATAGLQAGDVEGPVLWVAGAGTLVAGFYAGVFATRPLARAMAPLFVTELAPSEDSVVGSYGKVRSPELDDDDLGEPGRVVITSGPLKSAAFRAKAVPGKRFPLGATVFVVDADRIDGRLVVWCDEPNPELAP
jgi:hypothetical protein